MQGSGGVVSHDPLPTVMAHPSQLSQLFQDLVGNAIKYRAERPPQVHVAAKLEGGEWRFLVRDNGSGIEPAHLERIFFILRLLHTKEEYPSTSIVLAICKPGHLQKDRGVPRRSYLGGVGAREGHHL